MAEEKTRRAVEVAREDAASWEEAAADELAKARRLRPSTPAAAPVAAPAAAPRRTVPTFAEIKLQQQAGADLKTSSRVGRAWLRF